LTIGIVGAVVIAAISPLQRHISLHGKAFGRLPDKQPHRHQTDVTAAAESRPADVATGLRARRRSVSLRQQSVLSAALSALLLLLLPVTLLAQSKPLLIDAHMHVWSHDPARFPFAHPYEAKFTPPKIPASVQLLVEEMDRHGVTHCVLVQTIYHGWDNRYLAHALKTHPKRFRGQGLIDPTDPQVAKNLETAMREHGLAGVRFSPMYYQGKDDWLNARATDAVWKKAAELDAVFNFFIASEQLPKLEDMVRRHPKVKVVIDHLGRVDLSAKNPEPEIEKLLALARYPNVWVKVSELSIISPSAKYPYRDTFELVKRVYDAFGADRLLWGTGFPGATRAQADRPTLEQELNLIRREIPFLTAEDREKILGKNAAKVWSFE
jgi:predicted TIM-barrel fold metal-dependent hydrolase